MVGEWKRIYISEAVDILSGGTPKTSVTDYWGGNIPWLSVADFNTGYRWVSMAEKSITGRGFSESATTLLNQGDIIISARGTVGVVAQLATPMAFNQSCYGIRGREGYTDTDFIYYALRHAVSEMKNLAHGGVFDTITRDTFKIVKIPYPPLSEQQNIAALLGALDDKIELNRRMNETLEATARLFFKDWFVDFGPTRAKAEGRQPYLAPELWALFPDSLDDDDKPIGWEEKPLSVVIEPIGGGTPKTSVAEYWNGSIPWFSVVDAPTPSDVFVIKTEKTITPSGLENSSTKLIPRDATIITARGTVGKLALVGIEMAMNQSCYAMTGRVGWPNYFTHFLLKNAVQTLQANAHGSVFDTITRATFDTVSAYCPTQNIAVAFDHSICDLMEQIRSNLFENNTLAQLRDLLLPKLMSGEIRLREAEKMVEKVA